MPILQDGVKRFGVGSYTRVPDHRTIIDPNISDLGGEINSIIDTAPAEILLAPNSTYTSTTKAVLDRTGCIIRGGGVDSTFVDWEANGDAFHIGAGLGAAQTQWVSIRDLTIRASAGTDPGVAVNMENVGYSELVNVKVVNDTGGTILWDHCIKLRAAYANQLQKVVTWGYGGDGVTTGSGIFLAGDSLGINDANRNTLQDCRAIRGGIAKAGVWIRSSGYNHIVGGNFESAGSEQNLYLEGAQGTEIENVDFEEAGTAVTKAHITSVADAAGVHTRKTTIVGGQMAAVTGNVAIHATDTDDTYVLGVYVPSPITTFFSENGTSQGNYVVLGSTDNITNVHTGMGDGSAYETTNRMYGRRGYHLDLAGLTGLDWAGDVARNKLAVLAGGTRFMLFDVAKNPKFVNAKSAEWWTDDGDESGTKATVVGPSGLEVYDGYILMKEKPDPGSPAANHAYLYTRDNGAGKTEAAVKFASGAVVVLATDP